MKPVLIPHSKYQDSVIERLGQHYSGGTFVIANDDLYLVAKLWMTDLSYITTLLLDCYVAKGPVPRDPASILRSNLLFPMTKPEIGITKWVTEMIRVPYYSISSGFDQGDIPGGVWPARIDDILKFFIKEFDTPFQIYHASPC